MQVPILSGIYTDGASDFRTSYPRNLIPVPKQQGVSAGYLRPADGVLKISDGIGADRGGINWGGLHYRVSGGKLITIDAVGGVVEIGAILGTGLVTFDYSFDRLSISTGGHFYLYNKAALTKVTDPDLGIVVDHIWVDGYFMTTDGTYLIVTELNDPFSVNPLKYGSSEADPDPILALLKVHNEPHALNRYTIEVFDNVGGTGFPFRRIDGAQIQKGTVGTHACCVFLEAVAFVGSGRNEAIAVWMASGGSVVKISSREIDQVLSEYSESDLSSILVEPRIDKGHEFLYIHLPDKTLVYDAAAAKELGQHIWFTLSSGLGESQYTAQNLVYCYNKFWAGNPVTGEIGYLTDTTADHWGVTVGWEFGTMLMYNDGYGAIFHELELVCLSGRQEFGKEPFVATQYSLDGELWSMPKYINIGVRGRRNKRLVWLNQGSMRHWRLQRFSGTSDARLSIARLEIRIEPLGI